MEQKYKVEQIFTKNYARLCAMTTAILHDSSLAQDAVQEGWIRLHKAKQLDTSSEEKLEHEFYTFAYGDKFVTVCGAVEQTDAQLLHEKYPDITFPDSIGDYKFQVASLDYKPTPSIQVSTSIPEGAELNSIYKQADETTYDHLLRMSISYYNEKKL